MKALPFVVNRTMRTTLSEQIVHGLTTAVRAGYYTPGERLPSINDMAVSLEVGAQTVRKALSELTHSGALVARPRSGITVADDGQRWFNHHVVYARMGGAGYYFSAMSHCLEEVLVEASVRMTEVRLNIQEAGDGMSHLQLMLDTQPVDLVLVDGGGGASVSQFVADRDIPVVLIGDGDTGDVELAGRVLTDQRPAVRELLSHLQNRGVSTLAVAGRSYGKMIDMEALSLGMACQILPLGPSPTRGLESAVERQGFNMMQRLISSNAMPDAVFFCDDYLLRGAYTALQAAGMSAPRDILLAAQVNIGHCPVLPLTLSRIEMDPAMDGRAIGHFLHSILEPFVAPSSVTVIPRFVVGESTR